MPSKYRRGSMTSSRTMTASGSLWTNVRVHPPSTTHLTVFHLGRRPVCPPPDTLGDHPKRHALVREHDPVRVRNLPPGDGARYPSRRPRHARNRGTRPEGRRGSRKVDQSVSRVVLVPNTLIPPAPQITKPSDPALKRSPQLTNKTSSSLRPWKNAQQLS